MTNAGSFEHYVVFVFKAPRLYYHVTLNKGWFLDFGFIFHPSTRVRTRVLGGLCYSGYKGLFEVMGFPLKVKPLGSSV